MVINKKTASPCVILNITYYDRYWKTFVAKVLFRVIKIDLFENIVRTVLILSRMITNMNGLNKFMVRSNINMRFIIVLLSCQMYIILIYIFRLGKKSQFSRYIRITRYKSQYRTHPLKDGVKMHLLPACKFSKQCILHISRYFPSQFTFFYQIGYSWWC